MKMSQLKMVIREVVREEIRLGLKEVIGGVKKQPLQKPEPKQKQNYSKNPILNEVLSGETKDTQHRLAPAVAAGRSKHQTTQALRLPQLLFDEEGVHVIPFQLSEPNFITHKVVRGRCVKLGRHDGVPNSMAGSVVLIENADPGFDWIFAHNIGGLVTKFGGTNSHMAIRCAEFGIPAAIGCGEQIFERVSSANAVEINCAEGHIRPVEELMGST